MAYRVPRRFIIPPQEPPPYGLVALSFLGHALFLLGAAILSVFVNAQIDQSKIYIVNLVPAAPVLGSPTPVVAPQTTKAPEPAPPKPRAEPPPPKPAKAPPPARPEKAPELPPRAPERAQAEVPRRDDFALPRRAERELPPLESRVPVERPVARATPPAPVTAPPAARPERDPQPPPRVATPPAPPAVAAARPGVEPMRLGQPNAAVPATGSISLDVSDFPFTFYLRLVQKKIGESWSPPRAAAGGGEKTIVLFEIGRDGQIKEPTVERSSGNALYDQSALRAVMGASPFPPLPPEFKAPSLRVHFGFEFKAEQG